MTAQGLERYEEEACYENKFPSSNIWFHLHAAKQPIERLDSFGVVTEG